jgi:hypothetical protein
MSDIAQSKKLRRAADFLKIKANRHDQGLSLLMWRQETIGELLEQGRLANAAQPK